MLVPVLCTVSEEGETQTTHTTLSSADLLLPWSEEPGLLPALETALWQGCTGTWDGLEDKMQLADF